MSGQKELTNLIGSKPIERKLRKTYFKLEDVLQKYQPVVYETEVWPRIDLDTPAGHCPFICSREEHKDRLQLHEDLKKGTTTSKRKSLREKRIKRTINYCECCGCSISCLDKHLESTDHKSFVENKENYGQVEDFIKDLNRSSDSFLDQYIQHSIKEQERLEQLKISEEEDKENNSQSANDLDDTLTLHDTFNEVKSSTALRNSHIFEANSASTPNQLCGSSELINSSLSKPKSICSSAGLSAQIESLSLAFKGKANTKTPKTPPIQRLLTSPGFQLQNFNISITPGSMQITPRCVDQNQPLSNVTETECFVSGGFNQELKQRKKRLFSPVNGNGSAREEAQSWANTATDDITGKRFKGNPVEECDSVYADALPSLVKCPDIIEFCETELNSGVNEVSQGIASDCTTPTMSAKSVVSSSSAVKPEFGSPATHHSSDESANSPVIGTKLCISSRPGYVPVEETKEASWQPANEETVSSTQNIEEENSTLTSEIESLVARLMAGTGMPNAPSLLANQQLESMEISPSKPWTLSAEAINSSNFHPSFVARLKPSRELSQKERMERRRICYIFNKKLKHNKFDVTSLDEFAKRHLDIDK